jgi:hypothetical protein
MSADATGRVKSEIITSAGVDVGVLSKLIRHVASDAHAGGCIR